MSNLKKLTSTNGFDFMNLNNARQNNYAWSMSELDDYIYVGTGRNILVNIIRSIEPNAAIPALILPDPIDNRAEIWRYKKDGTLPWKRVYPPVDDIQSPILGFRYMISHRPFNGSPCIYAAAYGARVQILKTANGINWTILPDSVLEGTSSRAMVVHEGYIYLATINESSSVPDTRSLLYRSEDPEFYPWEPVTVTDPNTPGYDPAKNPSGAISNMEVFNNRLYVATSNANGFQVWRTDGTEPQMNEWTLIGDDGFNDPANVYTLGIGVFKDYLYVSATKSLPLSWAIPRGCDIIRIDKCDNWELVVGGNPLIPIDTSDTAYERSLSGLGSGFNNPFNVYGWQIQEYQDQLFISTFDDSSNMEVILNLLLANRLALYQIITPVITDLLIDIYRGVIEILRAIRYPIGFDLYVSKDGVNFDALSLRGFGNPNNYGGRILFVDNCNKMYVGTANPFEGCEVWRINSLDRTHSTPCKENHYKNLWDARKILEEKYYIINDNMEALQRLLPTETYHNFI